MDEFLFLEFYFEGMANAIDGSQPFNKSALGIYFFELKNLMYLNDRLLYNIIYNERRRAYLSEIPNSINFQCEMCD